MVRKTVHRMSPAVVVIGYILLIPSIIGIALNVVILVVGWLGIGVGTAGAAAAPMSSYSRQQLVDAGVPTPIIEKLEAREVVTVAEMEGLTQSQRSAVQVVQGEQAMAVAAGACCGIGLTGSALFGALMCFVSGLLGWLLVMRKKVLQCASCGAVVAAS